MRLFKLIEAKKESTKGELDKIQVTRMLIVIIIKVFMLIRGRLINKYKKCKIFLKNYKVYDLNYDIIIEVKNVNIKYKVAKLKDLSYK